jgi:hypothetical protein
MGAVRRNMVGSITPFGGDNTLKLTVVATSTGSQGHRPKVSVPLQIAFKASGGVPPYSFSVPVGSLPTGMPAINTATGLSNGTPTAAGTFAFTAQVVDSAGVPVTVKVTQAITVIHRLIGFAVTPTPLERGVAYSYTLRVAGALGAVTWAITSGALPTGISLNASTGVLSGTPTVFPSSQIVEFTATDAGSGDAAPFTCALNVSQAITATLTPTSGLGPFGVFVPFGYIGHAYTVGISISGGVPPYTVTMTVLDGTTGLPKATGLTVSSDLSQISGTILSTASPSPFGGDALQVVFKDSVGATINSSFSIVLSRAPTQAMRGGVPVGSATANRTDMNGLGASRVTNSDGLTMAVTLGSNMNKPDISCTLPADTTTVVYGTLTRAAGVFITHEAGAFLVVM